ncbi:hypothetical protein D1159_18745 [Pseudoflavonifractor sp. 524-17]|uniref:hypothetical protein n=1 Tax=Pseudoflavonifractor sp. 524-17 TaxID=2304577 RepID=UPI00137AAB10|nr:hypothetical protein [Pseudoflavonifractor sp. 524-17]NCE66537.1 hypothetical protein [Pseudoflavonifractor sp. 524-17]
MTIGSPTLCPCCGEPTKHNDDLNCGHCAPVVICKECGIVGICKNLAAVRFCPWTELVDAA